MDPGLDSGVRGRRRGAARRVVVDAARRVVVGARRVAAPVAARLVDAAPEVTRRRAVVAAFLVRVAVRLAVDVARRRVDVARVVPPRAICRACLVSPSMRLSTLFTSARVLARLTCVWSCLIAARAVLSASFSRLST